MSKLTNENAIDYLNTIDNYNKSVSDMINEGSLLLSAFQDPDGNDTNDRINSVKCSDKIINSLNELYYLNGSEKNKSITKWLEVEDIYLLRYVPYVINEIKDSSGLIYPNSVRDFSFAHKILKPWMSGRRGNHLQVYNDFFYDDTYIMQRTITKFDKSFTRIKGSDALRDFTTSEWESSVHPTFPNDFTNCMIKNNSNAMDLVDTFYQLNYRSSSLPEFIKIERSFNDLKNDLYIYDEGGSYNYAKEIIDNAPNILFYKVNDHYMTVKLIDKKIEEKDTFIKEKYRNYYNNSKDATKFFVYNNGKLKNYYKDFNYKATLKYKVVDHNLTDKELDIKVLPVADLGELEYVSSVDKLVHTLTHYLQLAQDTYIKANDSKCKDGNPDLYTKINDKLSNTLVDNIDKCNFLINYISTEVYPFINNRISYLNNYATNKDNSDKLYNLLLKRLTKNTGSLLIWYQSLLQFDDLYDNLSISKNLAENICNKHIITRGFSYNEDDALKYSIFNYMDYPKYIDIEDLDDLYGDKKFKVGDIITILDSGFNEQSNKIVGITTVTIPGEKSNVEGIEDREDIKFTRLMLSNRLFGWCKTAESSNILIMKES